MRRDDHHIQHTYSFGPKCISYGVGAMENGAVSIAFTSSMAPLYTGRGNSNTQFETGTHRIISSYILEDCIHSLSKYFGWVNTAHNQNDI
jgi:hypothetical protein